MKRKRVADFEDALKAAHADSSGPVVAPLSAANMRTVLKMRHSEHDEQAAVVAWARLHEVRYPVLKMLFAVPNGASLAGGPAARARQMTRLKAEGLKPGVPDLWLVAGVGEKHGLVIEMKAGRNKPTIDQKWWLQTLEAMRWQTAVCYSADDAIATIKAYIGLP